MIAQSLLFATQTCGHRCDMCEADHPHHLYREKTKDALVPPNPKELDMATSTCLSCDWRGTKLKSVPTFGLCRFSVGGTAF